MSDVPEFTKRGVFFGRLFFALFGTLLIGGGALMSLYFNPPRNWLGAFFVIFGLLGLFYSFAKRGKDVAHSAKTLVEGFDE